MPAGKTIPSQATAVPFTAENGTSVFFSGKKYIFMQNHILTRDGRDQGLALAACAAGAKRAIDPQICFSIFNFFILSGKATAGRSRSSLATATASLVSRALNYAVNC